MRAVVTGGAGFIGSHVVDALLARGDEVHVLDDLSKGVRGNVAEAATLHVADLRDADRVFDAARPEAVLHLAAQADVRVSVDRPDRDAEVNVLGTLRVLEAARRHGAQVVFASTGGAIYGDGRQTRDYVYVGDVVAAVLAALGRDGGVYNVGTGVETSVLELYEAVQQSAGVRREAEHADARAGELQRSVLDVSLAARELGWRPELDLADGLAETWRSLEER